MSSFQSSVFINQAFNVPGEIFQDVPWTILSYTLDSNGTPNIIGSTAYTITSEGFAQAGNGGTLGFAGFLCAPKDYALQGVNQAPLAATLEIPDFSQSELITRGMLAVSLPAAANIGDLIIYDNTTGAISSIPPTDSIPTGFTFANATVSQFTQTISGEGLAVILIDSGSSASSNIDAFTYVNAYWATGNGLSTNNGSSIERPFRDPQDFIDAVNALPDPTVPCVLNIPDTSTYSSTTGWTFPNNCNILINAPGANFSTSGTIGVFRGNGGNFKAICGLISAPGQRLLTWGGNANLFLEASAFVGNIDNDSGPGSNITLDGASLQGHVASGSDNLTTVRVDFITGDVTDTSAGASGYKMGIFARHVGGNISSTNTSIYGQVFDVGGSVSGIIQGIFDGTLYNIA